MLQNIKIHIILLTLLATATVVSQPATQESGAYESYLPNYFPLSKENFKRLSSAYGYRIHPVHNKIKKHKGIDLSARKGSGVYASAKGTVAERGYDEGYGNYIILQHKKRIRTLYGHLFLAAVKKGDTIQKGQVIGYVGDTGLVTGPHLHFEIWINKKRINPFIFWNNTVFNRNEVTDTSK
jgi:murein DD-endopeptidase MepM/ murein hydrolase activator NlpD